MMIIIDDWIPHRDIWALWALIFLFKWVKETAAERTISQQPVNIFNNTGGGRGGWMNVSHVVNVSTIFNTFTFQSWSYRVRVTSASKHQGLATENHSQEWMLFWNLTGPRWVIIIPLMSKFSRYLGLIGLFLVMGMRCGMNERISCM